jgi:hypothetical protein
MRATVPTELLLRFLQATPEQQAAIERILGWSGTEGTALTTMTEGTHPPTPEAWARPAAAELGRVFRLFSELLAMGSDMKAPPARVFDLMVFRKLTKAETAVACKCAASLITKRVALIEAHFSMPVEELLAFASDLKERQRTVKGDRYAKKARGPAPEDAQQYDDKTGPKEDDDGFLPEERPDYG